MFPAQEVQGMKVRNSLRSMKAKDGSYVVRRHGRVFVMNKRAPRLKARQG
jgi:large subunit ribosomal protein L36